MGSCSTITNVPAGSAGLFNTETRQGESTVSITLSSLWTFLAFRMLLEESLLHISADPSLLSKSDWRKNFPQRSVSG